MRNTKLSEAGYRDALFSPLLRTITNSIGLAMPSRSINDNDFETDYSVEEIIEFNPSQPGRKPSVDYVLRGDMNGDVLFYTPVEAKKEISIEDLNQLSLYMAKVGTAKEIVEKCLLGYLIDRKHVQFAISPLTYFIHL